ncbi:hypothetical protein TNIN_20491 [Trichonephila inaurata madagascariensis]|uniref:Uncharacterized protein n=1 Tax=Trichonephila inaurata madagascariensis TaxID=2747483 RepID=A0A8X6IQU5_9ARAC|nr:hypothetical protein TNIN_20491 [Trichonephila inaurata madagascariensis]
MVTPVETYVMVNSSAGCKTICSSFMCFASLNKGSEGLSSRIFRKLPSFNKSAHHSICSAWINIKVQLSNITKGLSVTTSEAKRT